MTGITTATVDGPCGPSTALEGEGTIDPVPQYEVELILARQLADGLAVPVLLVDQRGDTVFFNEPAEVLLGRRFDEVDALPLETRAALMAPRFADGRPLPVEDMPGIRAMRERRPAHVAFHVTGLDGVLRAIEATGIPLESARGNVLGALVILWGQDEEAGRPEDR